MALDPDRPDRNRSKRGRAPGAASRRSARYAAEARHRDRRASSPSMVVAPLAVRALCDGDPHQRAALYDPRARAEHRRRLCRPARSRLCGVLRGRRLLRRHPHHDLRLELLGRRSRSPCSPRCVAGIIIGGPTLRLRSDYLAIVTLGFGEIVRITARNLADHRRGAAASSASSSPGCSAGTSRRRSISTTCSWSSRSSASWSRCGSPTRGSAAPGSMSGTTRTPPRRWASTACG